jgi:hypothetical protein
MRGAETQVTSIVSVTDSEQALERIEYLRGRGIVVAILSADSIAGSLAIQQYQNRQVSGSIRLRRRRQDVIVFCTAGVVNICEICALDMDAATVKLLALAELVGRLTRRLFGEVRRSRTCRRIRIASQLRSYYRLATPARHHDRN